MVSVACELISASRIRRSSESSTMDCDESKLNSTVFGIHDWLNYLQDQAAKYRKLVERADDPFIKTELLALASVCEEIADNIEDHLTGGKTKRRVARCQGCHERGRQLRGKKKAARRLSRGSQHSGPSAKHGKFRRAALLLLL
jgi:hypothetical protein